MKRIGLALLLLGLIVGCRAEGYRAEKVKAILYEPMKVTGPVIAPNYTHQTSDIGRIDVVYGANVRWTAIYGPNLEMDAPPVKIRLESYSEPTLYVEDGWVYLIGEWPMGHTDYVYIGARGTGIALQHKRDSAGVAWHRGFLVRKEGLFDHAEMEIKGQPSTRKKIMTVGDYIQVQGGSTPLPDAAPVSGASQEVRDLYEHILAVAELTP